MPDIAAVALPVALFAPNWDKETAITSSFKTDVTDGVSADEARQGMVDRPFRTVEFDGLVAKKADAGAFLTQARKGTGQRFYTPLVCDQAFLTSTTNSGASVLNCDTANRRLFVGYNVMVVVYDASSLRASSVHVGQIQSMTSTSITLTAAMPFTAPAYVTYVYPAMECDVDTNASGIAQTDEAVTFTMQARERIGVTALPSLAAAESIPSGEVSYTGFPVMTIPHTWDKTETGESRKSKTSQVGLDLATTIYGAFSLATGALTFLQLSRADGFRLLKFFDSRMGSLFVFWLPNQTADLACVSRTSSTVWNVEKSIDRQDILDRRFLAFWGDDSTCTIAKIVTVTDGGASWIVTVDAAIPLAAISNLIKLSFACLAKFNTDEIKEQWTTDGVMSATLKTVAIQANSCGTGEEGDGVCYTDFPTIPNTNTGEPSEPPWEPFDCIGAGIAVPMFFDNTTTKGSHYEPIRAADLNMPTEIGLVFKTGLVKDAAHTHAPALSAELMAALIGSHKLTYKGTLAGTRSRSPYQIRLTGTSPTWDWTAVAAPGLTVTRRYWQELVTYKVGATTYTLDIRVVAEWQLDRTKGSWGTVFYVFVFSNEINPSYVDGNVYVPFASLTFTHDDPLVWGPYSTGGASSKYAHPQMLICGVASPTSMHSPVGSNWVPPDQTRLAFCYKKLNGTPWSSGTKTDATNNSVFGTAGSIGFANITLGGGLESRFFQWVCIENGAGTGITAMKPTHAGWDESVGDLTPQYGNDISIRVCSPGQTAQRINACSGHPSEPCGGIGGTPFCFLTSAQADWLCIPTTGSPSLTVSECCLTTITEYDAWDGLDCPVKKYTCNPSFIGSGHALNLWDYTYQFGGDQAFREIVFRGFENDPAYIEQDWTHGALNLSRWSAQVGSWSLGSSSFTVTAVSGSNFPSGFAKYDDPADTLDDGEIEAVSASTTAKVGIGARFDSRSGSYCGYAAVLDRVGGKATIYKVINNTTTSVLVETTGLTLSGSYTIKFRFVGSKLTFYWGTSSITCDDCTYQTGGEGGVLTFGAVAGAVFTSVKITDINWRKLYSQLIVSPVLYSADVPFQLCPGTASCVSSPSPCPSEATCPCTLTEKGITGVYSGSHDFSVGTDVQYPGGPNPDPFCAGEPLADGEPACGDCPPPWVAFSISMPSMCARPGVAASTNIYAGGMDFWKISHGVIS